MSMAKDSALISYIDRLSSAHVLCIGDVMLEHYVYGKVEPVSPEAPIPVLWIEREMKTLGGVGNVLRNLRGLGVAASFISAVGNDDAGREIGRLVEAEDGTEAHLLVQHQRPTAVKTRYIAGNQQLLRTDRESTIALDPYTREDLLRLARELVADHPVVVVSDYAKGVLTEGVALEIIRAAHEAGGCVIVDPKGGDPIRYRGADIVKPNRRELAHATGMPVATDSEIVAAAGALIDRCGFGAVLASLGAEGSVLVTLDGTVHTHRAEAREVFDVSGAGDTVVATLAAALGIGMSLTDAVWLANTAADIVVGKMGTAIVYANELAGAFNSWDPHAAADTAAPDSHPFKLGARRRRQGLQMGSTSR